MTNGKPPLSCDTCGRCGVGVCSAMRDPNIPPGAKWLLVEHQDAR